ncbi:DUF6658 family protein [Phormidesmis sp. 146-33]
MKRPTFSFKEVRIKQILMVFLAGFVLLLTTACSDANLQGSRPDNTPVQIGGNNNPHKMGGEGSESEMTADPKITGRSNVKRQAQSSLALKQVADNSIKSNASDLNYRGSNNTETDRPDIGAKQQKSLPSLPLQKQPVIDRSDPDAKILERVGEAFKDASSFVKDTADSASARPEAKANPAIGQ